MPKCHQAVNIIATQSFWIIKPFRESVTDALKQFKSHGYAQKLKTQITPQSIALGHQDLLAFLHYHIINIWKLLSICMVCASFTILSYHDQLFYSIGRVQNTSHLPHAFLFCTCISIINKIQVNIMDLRPLCPLVQCKADITISKTWKFKAMTLALFTFNMLEDNINIAGTWTDGSKLTKLTWAPCWTTLLTGPCIAQAVDNIHIGCNEMAQFWWIVVHTWHQSLTTWHGLGRTSLTTVLSAPP